MLPTANIKAVVFELDGTLVDTAARIQIAAKEMLTDMGLPHLKDEHISDWIGDGFQTLVHRILSRHIDGIAPEPIFRIGSALFLKAYQKQCETTSKLYQGVENCLQQLSRLNIFKVVLTNQTTSQANEMLTKLGIIDQFNLILGKDALQEPKPSPAGLFEVAYLLRLNPEQLLMVGGNVNDVIAARAAGCSIACVSYGYNYGADIKKAAPDVVLDSLDNLKDILEPSPFHTAREFEFISHSADRMSNSKTAVI